MVCVDKLNRSHQPQQPLFPVASEVEVSSDEEGLHGAWFVAKVLPLPPNRPSNTSLFVEYKTLVSDDKRLKPLREFADISFVRPLPPSPSESEKAAPFDLNVAVDAYHLDGWWTGVVTEVLGLNRYKVSFPNPPDVIEFEQSSLRLHRDWVDGKWVVPKKQIMSKLSFTPGTAVEVNLEVDHHLDIWYPGTVSKFLGEGLYAVKYDSVNKVGGHDEVVVNSIHIRPSPPRHNHKNFQLLEKVEAFCNSGWSSGIVTKLLSEERYIVYFKHTRKEKELHHYDLRLPVLWNDGIWVPSSQNSSVISNSEEATVVCNPCTNGKPSVSSDTSAAVEEYSKKPTGKDLAVPSGNLPFEETSMSTTRRVSKRPVMLGNAIPSKGSKKQVMEGIGTLSRVSKSLVIEGNATPSTVPKTQVMEGNARPSGVSKRSSNDAPPKAELYLGSILKTSTAEESTDKIRSGIKTSTSSVKGTPCRSASQNANHSCTLPASEDSKMDIKEGKSGLPTNEETSTKRRGWPKGKPRGTPRPSSAKTQKETVLNKSMLDSSGKHVIISLPCSLLDNSLYDGSPCLVPKGETMMVLKEREKQLGDFVQHGDIDNKVLKNEVIPLKRKRGRPFGSKKRSVGASSKPVQGHTKLPSSNKRRRNARVPVKFVGGSASEEVVMDFGSHTYVSSKGRKVKTTMAIFSAAQALSSAGNASQNGEVVLRNKPASKFPQSVTKETNVTERDKHGAKNVSQCGPSIEQTEEIHDGDDVRKFEHTIRQKDDEIVGEAKSKALPFVKTSPLWEMIESMDVFKQLPQEPHFHPLCSCKEQCREGLAIGGMVTFAGLVQKIPKFQIDGPRSILESSVETLVDLEKHGFDVGAIRSRLRSLLESKSRQEQSFNLAKETGHLITVRCQEKAELDNELIEIDRQIDELRQKRAAVVLVKERKEAEVVDLESSVQDMKRSIEVARSEFDRVVTAPW